MGAGGLIFEPQIDAMKLTLNQILDLYNALTALRGEPSISVNERGQKETIYLPYPLSDRVKWCAAHNRGILKKYVIAHDETLQDRKAEINAFKKTEMRRVRGIEDPKEQEKAMKVSMDAIQDVIDEANESNRKIGREEAVIEGLRLMPAKGFRLKTSNLPPTIIADLMPLIEGEPNFDEEKEPAPKQD